MNVNRLAIDDRPRSWQAPTDGEQVRRGRYRTVLCDHLKAVTNYAIDQSVQCVTQPRGIFRDHVQHRLNIRRRASDDAENLTRRGLLLQRFGYLAIAFLQFFEQANVLNCDHGLVSKSLEQRDLLVCERTDLLAPNRNDPDGQTFPQ